MTQTMFNPFTDRLSRDIRNELSESILEVIETRSMAPAQKIAQRYLSRDLEKHYRNYITDRLDGYSAILSKLPDEETDWLRTAAILWDQGLIFEVHEILEPVWFREKGDKKLILQALIRAAGVYINLEQEYTERAAKIAQKALPVLKRYKTDLAEHLRADALISALEQLTVKPPILTRSRAV